MSTLARRCFLVLFICTWVGLLPAIAAAQVADATLIVRVKDTSGGVVPGATVDVVATATGMQRTVPSGPDGTVSVPHLAIGTYKVTVSLSGFTTQVQQVTLLVGQTSEVSYQLAPSSVAETVEVRGVTPTVETNNATVHQVVTPEQVQTLPINGRDFSTLATLAPGATQGNTSESHNFDPVKRNLPAIAINGQSGRNVDVLLDGGDNIDSQIGGQNMALSLEAVQEFEVITHDPKPQFNHGIGGIVNVVTKSGGNNWSGSGFGFFRSDKIQSEDALSLSLDKPKPPFSQQQFGGTLGGPIEKDKAFFFASYERQNRTTSRVYNSGGAFPTLDGTATPQPFNQDFFLGKINGTIKNKHSWMVRYAEHQNTSSNEFFADTDAPCTGCMADESSRTHDVVGSLTSIFGTNKVNDLRFHYQHFVDKIVDQVRLARHADADFPCRHVRPEPGGQPVTVPDDDRSEGRFHVDEGAPRHRDRRVVELPAEHRADR